MRKIITIMCFFMIMTFVACGEKTEEQKSALNSKTQSEAGTDKKVEEESGFEETVTKTELKFKNRKTIVAGNGCSAGITNDGMLYENTTKKNEVIIDGVISVDIGYNGSGYIALKKNGTVIVGNIGDKIPEDVRSEMKKAAEWKDIVAVTADVNQFIGLKANGTVVVTSLPDNYWDTLKGVEKWTDIVAISAYGGYCAGLKNDGTVIVNGLLANEIKEDGGDISSWKDIVDVSCNYGCVFGLKSDGTVVYTSTNYKNYENISSWTDIVAISAGDSYCVGLKSDGTVVSSRIGAQFNHGQGNVGGWTDIVAVSAGNEHTLGLKSDGTVVAAGRNTRTECEVENWTNIQIP